MDISNLIFFNADGDRIQTSFDEVNNIYVGQLSFKKISVNLFETDKIIILEKVLYDDELGYNSPIIDTYQNPLVAELIENSDKSYFDLFTIVQSDDVYTPIFTKAITGTNTKDVAYSTGTYAGNPIKDISQAPDNTGYEFNISFNPREDCAVIDYVVIKYGGITIAKFELYGEAEDHDERFSILLNNLIGNVLGQEENTIFLASDVNEPIMDAILLNEKRKELLLEHSNIFPYIPSYLGLIRVLKFFGYDNMRIKEHWKNEETGTTSLVPVVLSDPIFLRHPNYKTGKFSLFYDILAEVDGEYDEYGIPITERISSYSPDEILIKIFALKKWLIARNIGLGNLQEIVGEASYYHRYDMRIWNDLNTSIEIHDQPDISFTATSLTNGYIDDIRHLNGISDIDTDINSLNYASRIEEEIIDVPISNFDPHDQSDDVYESYRPDIIDNPIADVRILDAIVPIATWSNFNISWNDLISEVINITWNNIDIAYYYEITWEVTRRTTEDDNRQFRYIKRLAISSGMSHRVDIPYDGEYDVKMVLHGYNSDRTYTEQKFIKSSLKNVAILSYHNLIDGVLDSWRCPISWNRLGDHNTWYSRNLFWNAGIGYDDVEYARINRYTMRISSLIETLSDVSSFPDGFGVKTPTWNSNIANFITWNEFRWNSWYRLDLSRKIHERVVITDVDESDMLYINGDGYSIPAGTITDVVDHLNDLSNDRDISDFTFIARPISDPTWIDMMTKDYDSEKEYVIGGSGLIIEQLNDQTPILWNNSDLTLNQMGIPWAASYDNCQIYRNDPQRFKYDNIRIGVGSITIPVGVPVIACSDISGIRGINSITWTLYRKSAPNATKSLYISETYKMFCYTFHEDGYYDLEMAIVDNNGNINKVYDVSKFVVKRSYVDEY